jgi:hypothetical protein
LELTAEVTLVGWFAVALVKWRPLPLLSSHRATLALLAGRLPPLVASNKVEASEASSQTAKPEILAGSKNLCGLMTKALITLWFLSERF